MNDFTEINKRMNKELKSSKYWWYGSIVLSVLGIAEIFYGIWVDSQVSVASAIVMMLLSSLMMIHARMCDLKLDILLVESKLMLLEDGISIKEELDKQIKLIDSIMSIDTDDRPGLRIIDGKKKEE